MRPLGRGRAAQWTREKIDTLTTLEVRQLRANAERLLETEIAALCNDVLGGRPRGGAHAGTLGAAKPKPRAKRKPAVQAPE